MRSLLTARQTRTVCVAAALTAALTTGCADGLAPAAPPSSAPLAAADEQNVVDPGRYLVRFTRTPVPADARAAIEGVGGTMEESIDDMGIVVASDLSDDGAAALAATPGVVEVVPSLASSFGASDDVIPVDESELQGIVPAEGHATLESPARASLYSRQWHLRAIHADDAWNAGFYDSHQARVAIFDTGIDYLHPELKGLVDLGRSRSFAGAEEDATLQRLYPGRNPVTDLFWHGTAVASLVTSNAIRLAGVNRRVTLMAVKIADRNTRFTSAAVIAAIDWAIHHGADVISLSGGTRYSRSRDAATVQMLSDAFAHAWERGVLVVNVSGNVTRNIDLPADSIAIPCQLPNVICGGATGPTSAASVDGPWANVDALAPYSNYGSAVSIVAPGGVRLTNTRVWLPCLTTPSEATITACRAGNTTGLGEGIGTSFSAPVVAGTAAMLVTRMGHHQAARIREIILGTVDDFGAPGWDPYFGWGRLNVGRAVAALPPGAAIGDADDSPPR